MVQMKKQLLLIYALLLVALISGCSSSAPTQDKAQHTTQNAVTKKSQEVQDAELQTHIDQIASAAKGRVGVSTLVLETGETISLSPRDHFPMQSVYKLPIGMAAMRQVDAGKIRLDQKVRVTKDDFI